ncbi:hypothetical protein Tsubulata_028065 [Turnera subulata]|uniref:CCHC-type domain-containing protein n=1 Tax=Turnera subulata TaxID=218843 RepID=A0A9Q0FDJ9_9ROSI|nr:hypothetical protein Tsubulata_028065 [Turnera subulata]
MAASSSSAWIDRGQGVDSEAAGEDVALLEDLGTVNSDPQFFLLARVMGSKHLNPRAFTNVMKGLWSPVKGMEITQLEPTLFLIHLYAKRDLVLVLKGEPWSFDKRLIVMKQVSGDEHFHNLPLQFCPFWVKIYNIPMSFRNTRHLALIAGKLGNFCEFDERGPLGWGKYVRVRIILDVTKPLKREILGRNAQGHNLVFPVKYDKLPNYCYGCGVMGHLINECDLWSEYDSDEEQELPYGDWLRASPTKIFISQVNSVPSQQAAPFRPSARESQAPARPHGSFLPPETREPCPPRIGRALDLDSLMGALPETTPHPTFSSNSAPSTVTNTPPIPLPTSPITSSPTRPTHPITPTTTLLASTPSTPSVAKAAEPSLTLPILTAPILPPTIGESLTQHPITPRQPLSPLDTNIPTYPIPPFSPGPIPSRHKPKKRSSKKLLSPPSHCSPPVHPTPAHTTPPTLTLPPTPKSVSTLHPTTSPPNPNLENIPPLQPALVKTWKHLPRAHLPLSTPEENSCVPNVNYT